MTTAIDDGKIPVFELNLNSKDEADCFGQFIRMAIKNGTKYYTTKGIPLENEIEVISALLQFGEVYILDCRR